MRKLFTGLISVITITILWINIRLYSENFTSDEKRADIILQLSFLRNQLKENHLGDRMQEIFPEGFVFINVLYGLSWCELAISDLKNDELKSKALKEALFAFDQISSDKAMSTFDGNLNPKYGIYYLGWKNYLLSKILTLDTTFADFSKYKDTFSGQCDGIVKSLKQNSHPYLQSYSGQAWPADMVVAMASIRNHEPHFLSQVSK